MSLQGLHSDIGDATVVFTDTFNASMTCLSMFFTVLAFGAGHTVSNDESVEIVKGLSWLIEVIEPSGSDAPSQLAAGIDSDIDHGDDTPGESMNSTPRPGQPRTLVEYLHSGIATIPGLVGPSPLDDENVIWLLPAGSAMVQILVRQVHERLPLLRYSAELLVGVTPTAELCLAANSISETEEFAKAYVIDGRVVLEYDQIVDELSSDRFFATLALFRGMADHYDTVLQDRFGGQTNGANVKAQFSA